MKMTMIDRARLSHLKLADDIVLISNDINARRTTAGDMQIKYTRTNMLI